MMVSTTEPHVSISTGEPTAGRSMRTSAVSALSVSTAWPPHSMLTPMRLLVMDSVPLNCPL
jgi:hypothetical protein